MMARHGGPEAVPDIRQKVILADELRPLLRSDPAHDTRTRPWAAQGRTFIASLQLGEFQRLVHLGLHQRTQIVHAADGYDLRDALERAKTDDDRALAVDMIRSVQDETQRAELTELAKLLADAP